jgi:hypothetical protein
MVMYKIESTAKLQKIKELKLAIAVKMQQQQLSEKTKLAARKLQQRRSGYVILPTNNDD